MKLCPKLYCFSRVSEGTLGSLLGSILALFRPSGPLCFHVREGRRFSVSGVLSHAVSNCCSRRVQSRHCRNSGINIGRKLSQRHLSKTILFFLWFPVSEGTFRTFWARFWRCSVLQGHCVSPSSGGCVFSLGRKSSSSNRSNRRVVCLIVGNSGIKIGRKL